MDCQADVAGCAKVWVRGRVVFRTDGELAILDHMGEVARLRGDLPTVLEHGAPGDSQSNGFVERAIRSVEDMIRTHKLALEEKIGEVLKVDTAAMVADRALCRHAQQVSTRKGWQDAVRKVGEKAVQWIYAGVWVAGVV